jgi:hypothetical protein
LAAPEDPCDDAAMRSTAIGVLQPLAASTVETAVWMARNVVNSDVASSSGDTATVHVPEPGATAAGVAAGLVLLALALARGRGGRRPRLGRGARWRAMAALAVLSLVASCGQGADLGADLSPPIIHIGANVDDPRVMETAILVVIRAPFATVRDYVSDPANVRHYLAFVTDSTAEPVAGGAEGEQRLSLRMSVADVFGVSVSGMPMTLRWRPVPSGEGVLAVAFERIEGGYQQLSGSIYAMDLADGSTAAMLRVTSRSGFVPEAVRERLARWHAEESLRKLAKLLESARSS